MSVPVEDIEAGGLTAPRLRTYLAGRAEPWVRSEVSRLRREAAASRHRALGAEADAEALRTDLADVERAADELRAELRDAIGRAHGLPEAIRPRVQGSTAEEIEADAAWWATNLVAGGGSR